MRYWSINSARFMRGLLVSSTILSTVFVLAFKHTSYAFASKDSVRTVASRKSQSKRVDEILQAPGESDDLYKYKVEIGKFVASSGTTREYTIYSPDVSLDLPPAPFPTVVLAHGFLMTAKQQKENGEYFARRGMIVIAPNISKLLLGEDTRMHNIYDIMDLIHWLTSDSKYKDIIDVNRFAVGGNSSGGAVALEILIQLQKKNFPCKTVCFLDGVPWDKSWAAVKTLKPLNILTLRAEDALCNEKARMLSCLAPLPFAFDDVKIVGAHHCDAEAPTTLGCLCVCGKSDPVHRAMFQRVLYLYLRDTLNAHNFEIPSTSFSANIQAMKADNKVEAKLLNLRQN